MQKALLPSASIDTWGTLCRITFAGAAVRSTSCQVPVQTTDQQDKARLAQTSIPAFLDRKQVCCIV